MTTKNTSIKKMILVLSIITLISGISLAIVNKLTQKPIETAQNLKNGQAILNVLPNFDGQLKSLEITIENEKQPLIVHMAYQNNQWVGAAIETFTNQAFNGTFTVMVGFDTTGTITGTEVLEHNESPGLGDKIDKQNSNFSKQFVGLNPANCKLIVKNDGGDIDAITAATISSRAYCDAIQRAYAAYNQVKEN